MAVYDGQQYLLPLLTVMETSDISISKEHSKIDSKDIRLVTPGGEVILSPEDLRISDGQLVILQSALSEKLLMDARFDHSTLAIYLELPWNRQGLNLPDHDTPPEAQFSPPTASIRNLRADLNYVSTGDYDGWVGNYFSAGNLAGGNWRVRVEQESEGQVRPFDYFWARSNRNTQLLLGNAGYSLHPLLSTVEQTGLQFLHSTAAIPQSNFGGISNLNGSRRIANGIRNIEGLAIPGSIAELRIDGGVVARTRVRLDGTYDFLNVELPSRGYSEVLVHILDRSTGVLMEAQNFSRRSGIELLGNGQQTLFATLGKLGNPLDKSRNVQGLSAGAQWRYGITEDVTLELGHQEVGGRSESEGSLSMALFKNWFASLGYATVLNRDAAELSLEGGDDIWSFDFLAREYETTGLLEQGEERRQWSRFLNYRYQVTDNFSLGLVGRDVKTNFEEQRFISPSANWTNHRNFSVSASPNISGDYRIDSRFSTSLRSIVRYSYESERHLVDYRFRNGLGREYYANFRTGPLSSNRFELGLTHYSNNDLLGRTQVGLVSNSGRLGYTLDWESRLIPGFNSRLRLAKGGNGIGIQEHQDESDLYLQWNMTLDFAVAQNQIVPADSSWNSLDSASLTGEVLLGGKRITDADGISQVELIVDGDGYTARVQRGRYYVDGLAPGLHKISIDSRHLPIEIMPGANQNYWVRLEAAAATEVPIILEARYAVAGRVRDLDGEYVVGLRLSVLNEKGRQVSEAYTDQYGLYRADSLPPGEYYIVAEEDGERLSAIQVQIIDEFLFEQDLLVP
ncbi:MAG: carboxypeptidase-like regulatory domain-containing protein [Gammaproteobacteria bacterium]